MRSLVELIHAQMFLDTPHTDDVKVWADRIRTTTELGHRNGRIWRTKQILEHAENFVDITQDFQQLSSLYVIIYFCNEDWLECSEATVSRSLVIVSITFLKVLLRFYIPTACGQWYLTVTCNGLIGRTTTSFLEARPLFGVWATWSALCWASGKVRIISFLIDMGDSLMNLTVS